MDNTKDLGSALTNSITSRKNKTNKTTLGSVPILGALQLDLLARSAEIGSSKKAAFS